MKPATHAERDFFEALVYRSSDRRRFTQQSPVMPEVWIAYALAPGEPQDLLLVPNWHHTPAELGNALRARLLEDATPAALVKRLARFRAGGGPAGASVAANQNSVVARLYFDQLLRAALPLSSWWKTSVLGLSRDQARGRRGLASLTAPKQLERALAKELEADGSADGLQPDIAWLARLAGLIAHLGAASAPTTGTATGKVAPASRRMADLAELEALELATGKLAHALAGLLAGTTPVDVDDRHPLYSANLNRTTTPAVTASVAAIKADAATRVFGLSCDRIAWAVIDSGIDARHVAFRQRQDGLPLDRPFVEGPRGRASGRRTARSRNQTRVVATYDFVHVRTLLGALPAEVDSLDRKTFPVLASKGRRKELERLLTEFQGRTVNWEQLEPFLEVPHDSSYRKPQHVHGTHVAGILGADWRQGDEDEGGSKSPPVSTDLRGVCPDIRLYDLRVLDERGVGNEFAIMSALQFVRDLNSRRDFVEIHGVNLSFSLEHDVANYACGRTPVCEEAERVVGSGVVVVAAAGNSGRARYVTSSNSIDDGFRTVSITDPGNADAVITVGSTHRSDAHTYGVSYFSSRGPTGDGRVKPDLVAPGEKILSTQPGDKADRLDGTSMAAPHVSGAAALIMARHPEFIRQPRRIKEVLCRSATDLGRERYFQGHGLVDVLRALQSI